MKKLESVGAVHTHTHTHTHILFKKRSFENEKLYILLENIRMGY